jgi:biopolymer transport protein ExbB
MNKIKALKNSIVTLMFVFGFQFMAMAQDGSAEAGSGTPGFFDIVFGGGLVDIFIWFLIFLTSIATVAFIISGIVSVQREKMLPIHVVEAIRECLSHGDLNNAIMTCEANPGSLSNILMAGFNNISEGFDVIQDSISAAADMETEHVMQKINYLNVCGQIAPMLGLMGTVTGMVSAFGSLATKEGAGKAKALAQSISGALWTTCVGLIIAVPALLGFTLIKNNATRIILETEAVVIDLVKVLRTAELDDVEEEEEEYYEED